MAQKRLKNLYFLGGPVQNISETLGLNSNTSAAVGGAVDLTEGILTGNPMSLLQGTAGLVGGTLGGLRNDKIQYNQAVSDRTKMFGHNTAFRYGGRLNKKELMMGTKEEMEHTSSKSRSKKIAIDHLMENSKYYSKLKQAGLADSYGKGGNMDALNWGLKNAIRWNADGGLIEYQEGGSHETNPYGGLPMGYSTDGNMNTVEQGETRQDDYIFSDRRVVNRNELDKFNLPTSIQGKTFADGSKILDKEYKERPNDPISMNTKKSMMDRLEQASEYTMPNRITNMFQEGGRLYNLPTIEPQYLYTSEGQELASMPDTSTLMPMSSPEVTSPPVNNNNIGLDTGMLRYAPVAGNLLNLATQRRPEDTALERATSRYTPSYLSEEAATSRLESGRRAAVGDIYGTSGGNLASARSNILGANVGFLGAQSDAYRDLALSNIAQDQAAQQFNVSQDRFNIEQANREEQIRAQNEAAFQQARSQGLQDIFQNLGNIGRESQLGDIVTAAYGYDPYGRRSNKYGGKLRFKMK